jgi:hypothetical protein
MGPVLRRLRIKEQETCLTLQEHGDDDDDDDDDDIYLFKGGRDSCTNVCVCWRLAAKGMDIRMFQFKYPR